VDKKKVTDLDALNDDGLNDNEIQIDDSPQKTFLKDKIQESINNNNLLN
jgi:hypothetical protein